MFTEENTELKDCNGTPLFEGDHVDDKWAGEMIVCRFDDGDYYGKLVCEPGHPCENIPYALNSGDIIKIDKVESVK